MRSRGIAAQETATNGPLHTELLLWMACAKSSLPVPLSPRIRTLARGVGRPSSERQHVDDFAALADVVGKSLCRLLRAQELLLEVLGLGRDLREALHQRLDFCDVLMTDTTPAISPSTKIGLTLATIVVPSFLWRMLPMRAMPDRSTAQRLPSQPS